MAINSGKGPRLIHANDFNIRDIVRREIARQGQNADLSLVIVDEVTDMSYLFYDTCFNGDISEWNVSNVVNMEGMFAGSRFDGDLSKWDVSNVKEHSYCFEDCPIGKHPQKQPKFNL
jgi:hypothetical protein